MLLAGTCWSVSPLASRATSSVDDGLHELAEGETRSAAHQVLRCTPNGTGEGSRCTVDGTERGGQDSG